MNIVVWGTGGNASDFINQILPICGDEMNISIIGIVDDCEAREGSYFHGFKVQHPSHLDPDAGIDYVVQLETYGGFDLEGSKEILQDYLKEKLVDLPGFCKIINSEGFWRNKSVLFIGDRAEYDGYAYGAKYIFEHHEYYNDIGEFNGDIKRFDFIFTCGKWYTSNEQSIREYREIRKRILKQYKYNGSRIINSLIWGVYLHSGNCRINTKGELNPDKKFLILTFDRYCGWAVIIRFFEDQLMFAEKNGYIPVVDLKNFKTQYISDDDLGKINVWDLYFNRVSDYSLEEVYSSKNVYLTGKKYKWEGKIEYRIKLNKETDLLLKNEYNRLFPKKPDKVLGVVFRGTDFNTAYGHPKTIGIKEFMEDVDDYYNHIGYQYIFLATEVEEAVGQFNEKFGSKVFYIDQPRYSKDEKRLLADIPGDRYDDEKKKSLEYLTVLYNLYHCDSVMGVNCSSTRLMNVYRERFEYFNMYEEVKNIPLHDKVSEWIERIKRKGSRTLKLGEYRRKS